MMKTILIKYALAGLFIVCSSQHSWSMNSDNDEPMDDGHPAHDPIVVHPAPPVQNPVLGAPADIDPALREKAHKAAQRAKKRLGLDKPTKIGIKATK